MNTDFCTLLFKLVNNKKESRENIQILKSYELSTNSWHNIRLE